MQPDDAYNLILDTDSYKFTHHLQYPPGTREVSSYIEARGGAWPAVVFFGLQAFLQAYWTRPLTRADVDAAEALALAHIGVFNRHGWMHIVEQHGGYLPVEIEAVPEGSVLPLQRPLLQIRNTDAAAYWLPGHLETALLRAVWYPSTVASLSFACRGILQRYLAETADTLDALPFQLHDFGARGVSSEASAALGGAAHLLNFQGTDTVSALRLLQRHYHEPLAGYSIPASEHSTMTSWGRAGESAAYAQMLDRFAAPGRVLAIVADSYDLWNAIDQHFGAELKARIVESGGRLVIRPDSGDPVAVLPRVIEQLMQRFGHRLNGRGYRVLPDCIRVIYGDGITLESLPRVLEALKQQGLSSENAAFGMGGGLLQKLDRDTLKWAMKACEVVVGEERREICKQPATDPGKGSRAGRQALVAGATAWQAVRAAELGTRENLLRPVWRDGRLLIDEPFSRLRARVAAAS